MTAYEIAQRQERISVVFKLERRAKSWRRRSGGSGRSGASEIGLCASRIMRTSQEFRLSRDEYRKRMGFAREIQKRV